jgi:hypothetical protein
MCWASNHQNTYKNCPRAHFPFKPTLHPTDESCPPCCSKREMPRACGWQNRSQQRVQKRHIKSSLVLLVFRRLHLQGQFGSLFPEGNSAFSRWIQPTWRLGSREISHLVWKATHRASAPPPGPSTRGVHVYDLPQRQ